MNLIDTVFERLRSQGKKAFIPFLTAGDPDLGATETLVQELAKSGASLIEIGFPYSDPLADGPVIQASYTRAINHGVATDAILATVKRLTGAISVPLVGMLSYSLIHRRGQAAFLDQAQSAGLSGAIIPDLPIEEAEAMIGLARERDFKLIHLVAPTTPRDRAVQIAKLSTGFLYYVSVTGITGERDRLPEGLLGQIIWLRGQTKVPICVGFGISKPEHVKMLREVADGIIVGSAFVKLLEGGKPIASAAAEMGKLAKMLEVALNPEKA